jgi:chromate transporter
VAEEGLSMAEGKKTIPHPTFAQLLITFTKIGFLSFGGPAGQIALMHRMLVDEKRWISENRFLHALNYCMLLPGPEAQQLAIYIGWLLHGVRGGLAAGLLFIIPGFLVIMSLSTLYVLYTGTFWLDAVFFGLKAAVLAVVLDAVLRVGKRALRNQFMIGLSIVSFIAIFAFQVPFPIIIICAGLIGFVGVRLRPDLFAYKGHEGGKSDNKPSLILETHEITPSFKRSASIILIGAAIWIAPILLLGSIFGSKSIFVTLAIFFSKMAVVTFGGAYAVLSYVAQEAVTQHNWLTPKEMLDGLALAETTPGPLILVLVYVGFIASFRAVSGTDPLIAAMIGGTLTTWVTFVPCFIWIFLGAPYVEKLRSNLALSGALSAITAAVVGVLVNLALWFALNTLFKQMGELNFGGLKIIWPQWASLDVYASLIALIAAFMLLRFKSGMASTLGLCALLGVVIKFYVP